MNRRVAVVTDSTASLPPELARRLGITVVQLQLQVGETATDEARVPTADLVSAMRARKQVATAPPPAAAFFWTYQNAVAAGVEAVVSIHLSTELSQTCATAREAAGHTRVPVHVIDSRACGMVVGFAAIAAAEAAMAGASPREVLNIVNHRLGGASSLIYVDTLEFLRRGGRIGAARALIGSALSIKPLLALNEGRIEPLERVRGTERAISRLAALAALHTSGRPVDVAVEHFASRERAEELIERLRDEIPLGHEFLLSETSAIIGAHTGPGALGVSISPC
ncbi:DegV family protein [Allokutzneria sp. NRRL B-24872]|uniref:DegV family protein n=1 Tax=Allokutzneria sp. NRRL B-24872 TaxID=1137961 RepID=UPI000A3C4779|nr:DegV family protein [Allokutzneria sp. NRRL B-24872]